MKLIQLFLTLCIIIQLGCWKIEGTVGPDATPKTVTGTIRGPLFWEESDDSKIDIPFTSVYLKCDLKQDQKQGLPSNTQVESNTQALEQTGNPTPLQTVKQGQQPANEKLHNVNDHPAQEEKLQSQSLVESADKSEGCHLVINNDAVKADKSNPVGIDTTIEIPAVANPIDVKIKQFTFDQPEEFKIIADSINIILKSVQDKQENSNPQGQQNINGEGLKEIPKIKTIPLISGTGIGPAKKSDSFVDLIDDLNKERKNDTPRPQAKSPADLNNDRKGDTSRPNLATAKVQKLMSDQQPLAGRPTESDTNSSVPIDTNPIEQVPTKSDSAIKPNSESSSNAPAAKQPTQQLGAGNNKKLKKKKKI
jgi:hypothetical protein